MQGEEERVMTVTRTNGRIIVEQLSSGDTIRISRTAKVNPQLRGKLAIVDEIKNWGVTADVSVVFGGICPVRLAWGDFSNERNL